MLLYHIVPSLSTLNLQARFQPIQNDHAYKCTADCQSHMVLLREMLDNHSTSNPYTYHLPKLRSSPMVRPQHAIYIHDEVISRLRILDHDLCILVHNDGFFDFAIISPPLLNCQ